MPTVSSGSADAPGGTIDPPALAAVVRSMGAADLSEVVRLHAVVFGPGAYSRTAYRIREGAPSISPYCLVSLLDAQMVAALRFTQVRVGRHDGVLMLGPLMVAPREAGKGYGKELVAKGLDGARAAGMKVVLLVGNASYYARFGFKPVPIGQIQLPGPVDYARLLAAELQPDVLAGFRGLVTAALPTSRT